MTQSTEMFSLDAENLNERDSIGKRRRRGSEIS